MNHAPDDTHLDQWSRILLGEIPPGFLLEVLFRLIVIYLILMVSMRLLGKRMASQLSRNDMAAMVSLAAAIGGALMLETTGRLKVLGDTGEAVVRRHVDLLVGRLRGRG